MINCAGKFEKQYLEDLAYLANPPEVDHLAKKAAHHAGANKKVRGAQKVHERPPVWRATTKPIVAEVRVRITVDARWQGSILCISSGPEVVRAKTAHRDNSRFIRRRPDRSAHDGRSSSQF